MKINIFLRSVAAALLSASLSHAATIVVDHDEWTFTDYGFSQAADTGVFVGNLVAEFGNNIHAYSNNIGFTESSLATAMSNAGTTYSTGTSFAFTLANISAFDAIMLGGQYLMGAELAILSSYVAAGGNVYVAGGTGSDGSVAEAASWNSFLAPFGIQLGNVYNGVEGTHAVSGDALFAGVSTLYSNNGNTLTGSSVVCCGQTGLHAVYRSDPIAPVPLPASGLLLVAALGGMGLVRSRKTSA